MLIRINEHYAVDATSIVSIRFHEAARPSQGVIGNSLVLHVKGEGRVLRDLMHVPGKSAHEVFKNLVSTINTALASQGVEVPDHGLIGDALCKGHITQDEGYVGHHHSDFDPGA